jgi:hypothetical protein
MLGPVAATILTDATLRSTKGLMIPVMERSIVGMTVACQR